MNLEIALYTLPVYAGGHVIDALTSHVIYPYHNALQAESLGNEGKVEEAQIKTAKCDELRTERLKFQEVTAVCCLDVTRTYPCIHDVLGAETLLHNHGRSYVVCFVILNKKVKLSGIMVDAVL